MPGLVSGGQARASRLRFLVPALACACAVPVLGGCGSAATQARPAAIAPPSVPSAESCGVGSASASYQGQGSRQPKRQLPPAAGIYRYRTRGRSGIPSEAVRVKDLPRVTELIVTKARRLPGLTCFRMQKRYTERLANTETYVIRGNELFLVGLRVEALGHSEEVRPVPAVLFGSNTGSQWSGQFSGRTSGSYSVTGLGERHYRVGDRQLKVTGVKSSVSYRGAVSGTQAMTLWISPATRLVTSEELAMKERLGVSEVRIHLRRRLLSLLPTGEAR
jgi:hypothetical protein